MTQTMTSAATGIAGLDDILRGGFPRDHIYLLQGDPGVGKTTLALQFLREGAERGETGLYITLSETAQETRQVAETHGWSLDGISLFELSAVDAAGDVNLENTLFDPAEVELRETMQMLLARVEEVKPSRVVFDSLSEIRLLSQSALRYRHQIFALKQYFTGKRSTVLLLDDRSSVNGTDMQVQSLAHGVLSLEQVAPEYGEARRRLRVLKLRGVKFRGGFHDFSIRTGGLVVFPRLVASEHHTAFERVPLPSGLAALDTLLGGGLDRGTSTLIAGPAGTGKSILASQFAVAAARRGERAVIFAFEEAVRTLVARSDALGMGMSELLRDGRLTVQQIDPAEMGAGEFTFTAKEAVAQGRCKVVVIDSINGLLNAMPQERYLTPQLHELLSFFGQQGVTTLMVMAQGGMFGQMTAPVDVSYLADSVMLLRHFEAFGHIRKALSVVKKRSGPHESTIRELTLDGGGIHIGAPLASFTGILTGVPTFHGDGGGLSGK